MLDYVPKGVYTRYNEKSTTGRQYYRMERGSEGDSVFLEWKQLEYDSSGWFIYSSTSSDGLSGNLDLYFYALSDEGSLPCPSKIRKWVPAVYYKDCCGYHSKVA